MIVKNFMRYNTVVLCLVILIGCGNTEKPTSSSEKQTLSKSEPVAKPSLEKQVLSNPTPKPVAKPEEQKNLAPDFELSNLSGKAIRLSDFSGKVIILDFFATWCPPCKAEIPHFVELKSEYGDSGLEIIGVSLDRGTNWDELLKKFASTYQINYPILKGTDKVVNAYGSIRAIPTTFVIDRNQVVKDKIIGYIDKASWEQKILPLLKSAE
jgi:peroxiredoxin